MVPRCPALPPAQPSGNKTYRDPDRALESCFSEKCPPLGLPWRWYPLLLADPNAEEMTSGPQEARKGLSALSMASHLSPNPKHTPQHIGACETSVHAVICLKCPCWACLCHAPRWTCRLALKQNDLPLALGLGAASQGLGRVLAAWCNTWSLLYTPKPTGSQGY